MLGKKRYNMNNFLSLWRVFFNHLLTTISNIVNKQNLTDAHTCYKVFSVDIFNKLNLMEKRFAFCPEVNCKISNMGVKILEVPINYNGRTKAQGKKISILDGFSAIFAIFKYKIR